MQIKWKFFPFHSCSPGSLKIGSPSQLDESTMKRSRTSSISSGSGIQAPKKTPGSCTSRNAIYSSYSSTGGLPKVKLSLLHNSTHSSVEVKQRSKALPPWLPFQKRRLPLSPPVSSSGSSRPRTPEGPSKSLRYVSGCFLSVIYFESNINRASTGSKNSPI